jgi:hypothetical protein
MQADNRIDLGRNLAQAARFSGEETGQALRTV